MSLNMEVAADLVWIIPTNSDVLARRLVNAMNLAYKEQLVPYQKLLWLLYTTNLSGIEIKGTSLNSLSAYRDQLTRLEPLKSTLSLSQQKVWK